MKLSYENYLRHPDAFMAAVRANARSERARVFYRLVVAPLKALFKRAPGRHTRMIHRSATAA
jgi:hypothetical protein